MGTVPATDADTLKAALLARGMLADRGRYTPFAQPDAGSVVAGDPNATGATVVAGTAAPGVSSSAPGAASPQDNPNAAGNTTLPVDDATLNKLGESDAWKLLIGLGIGTAAATAYLLRRRKALGEPVDDIPLVEGEDIGTGKSAKSPIVDGEFTEVAPKAVAETKKIPQGANTPQNQGMKALGAPEQVSVAQITKQRMTKQASQTTPGNPVARRAQAQSTASRGTRTQPNDLETIPLPDAMSDITPQEMQQAQGLVDQLKQNRLQGNAAQRRRLTGDRTLQSKLPTGTVNERTILNDVVRMIRTGKINPAMIARVIP